VDPSLALLLDALPMALLAVDRELRVVAWAPGAPGALPAAWRVVPESPLGKRLAEVFPGSATRLEDGLQAVLDAGATGEELIEEGGAGARRTWRVRRAPIHRAGEVTHALCWIEDVTERRRAEERLLTLDKAVETMQIGVTVTDLEGCILFTNRADAGMHGYEPEELIGRDVGILAGGGTRRRLSREQLKRIGSWRRESVNTTRDGRVIPVQLLSDVVLGLDGEPVALVTTCEDISERRRFEQRIEDLAYRDTLTGLPNRRLFEDRLRVGLLDARRRGRHLALVFVDLDGFKLVNDSLGHEAGDALLKEVAERLRACVREGDTVARLGGDEFTLLLPGVGRHEDLGRIAEKVLHSLRPPVTIAGQELFLSASLGVAYHPDHGDDVDTLLRSADAAMYRSKELGRDTYRVYESEMSREAGERLSLESGLRQALRDGELEAHYQPILACDDGRLLSLEALVRWRHPERGLLAPATFVPIAEATGLVVPLGLWMLRHACAQLRTWQLEGLDIPTVAVNVSGRHLIHPSFVEQVRDALADAGLAAGCLTLEITETASMERGEQIIGTLDALRALGVRLSIDDFGTGFSSLSRLNRFPIDALKIDGSFIAGVTGRPEGRPDGRAEGRSDAPIASAVIGLAHTLGLQVIAEGVETEAQLAFLADRRCDAVQGHLFSRPIPPDECAQLVRCGALAAADSPFGRDRPRVRTR